MQRRGQSCVTRRRGALSRLLCLAAARSLFGGEIEELRQKTELRFLLGADYYAAIEKAVELFAGGLGYKRAVVAGGKVD